MDLDKINAARKHIGLDPFKADVAKRIEAARRKELAGQAQTAGQQSIEEYMINYGGPPAFPMDTMSAPAPAPEPAPELPRKLPLRQPFRRPMRRTP